MNAAGSYRPEIDGLRAVSIVLVVLYHYGIGPVTDGFVGVDVFFVISGYLITSIIAKEMIQDRFSIVGFVERRVRRIVPVLALVVAACVVAGFLFLMPGDYESLGMQALHASSGISNF